MATIRIKLKKNNKSTRSIITLSDGLIVNYIIAVFVTTAICVFILLYCSLSSKMFIISQAALATEVPGPKIAATPAL